MIPSWRELAWVYWRAARNGARRLVPVVLVAGLVLTGAAKCTTSTGLPVHTKVWWLQEEPLEDIFIAYQPPPEPGWVKVGRTFGGEHVWFRKKV